MQCAIAECMGLPAGLMCCSTAQCSRDGSQQPLDNPPPTGESRPAKELVNVQRSIPPHLHPCATASQFVVPVSLHHFTPRASVHLHWKALSLYCHCLYRSSRPESVPGSSSFISHIQSPCMYETVSMTLAYPPSAQCNCPSMRPLSYFHHVS